MAWLELSEVVLVQLLDLCSDASVLQLSGSSSTWKQRVDACRKMESQGPWRQSGAWEASGLWRYLGLGDLKIIPKVTLCCETQFEDSEEVLAFFKAAKMLADDMLDNHVIFNKFTFPQIHNVLAGEEEEENRSEEKANVVFNDREFKCSIKVSRKASSPLIQLEVDHEPGKNVPVICSTSLVSPEVRLEYSRSCYEQGGIYLSVVLRNSWECPSLTPWLRANIPLPMFLGVSRIS